MRYSKGIGGDTLAQQSGCNRLLAGKARIKAIDENVCVNQGGHVDKGLLVSNLDYYRVLP